MPTLRLIAALGLASALLSPLPAAAFCLENDSANWVHVGRIKTSQGHWLRYVADVLPGKTVCCDWKAADCNPEGGEKAMLSLIVYGLPEKSGVSPGSWQIEIPAAGRIRIVKTGLVSQPLDVELYDR